MAIATSSRRIAVVVKGYPRLSETFIAQEILALEERGLDFEIWSLRHPTESAVHPMNKRIKARVHYLPEYLYREPFRVLKGAVWSLKRPGFGALMKVFWRDLKRDLTPNRGRRLGPGFRHGEGDAGGSQARARPLSPHPRIGGALRGPPHRPAVDVLGPCQGHLDDAGLGKAREARRGQMGGDLHRRGRRAPRRLFAVARPMFRSSITGSIFHGFRRRPSAIPSATALIPPTPSASSASGGPWRRRASTIFCGRLRRFPKT